MKRKLIIDIGIPAYNAERNIASMLNSLLRQKSKNYTLNRIFVHSDASKDNTSSAVRSINSKKILYIESKTRKGFSGSFKRLPQLMRKDVAVILNDDIRISDPHFLEKLVQPFFNTELGLVCGNPTPLPPVNFIDKAITSSVKVYHAMRYHINNGHNNFSVDGKILALSHKFIDDIKFPKNLKKLGNLDIYLYFLCATHKYTFFHAKNAIVYYRNPTTVNDYINWTARNNSNYSILRNRFGELVERSYKKPRIYYYYSFVEFIKNPLGCLFIIFMRKYINQKSKKIANNFSTKWEVITTTKTI